MRVLVVGGYGLIGGYVVAALNAHGHSVIGGGRRILGASRRFPDVNWIKIDLAAMTPNAWQKVLIDVDAVVNCAGTLQDSPNDDLQVVHVSGLMVLADAARVAGVTRLIHISASGMVGSSSAFGRTKLAAEEALHAQDIDWTILRPGLVFAPAAYGGSALLRALAAFPCMIPAVYPDSQIQVVSASGVAAAVLAALAVDAPSRVTVDLVSPRTYALGDILVALRGWLGFPPAPVISVPPVLAHLSGRVADALGILGWRSPMRSTALDQLRHGVRGNVDSARVLPSLSPDGLDAILAQMPSGVQERWFARLYLFKPLALAVLALFWIVSGLNGLTSSNDAMTVLAAGHFPVAAAKPAVLGGSCIDIALGFLACHRRAAGLALKGMVFVSFAYLVGASLYRPDLWIDPLGPLTKVVPGALLALAVLAVMDER